MKDEDFQKKKKDNIKSTVTAIGCLFVFLLYYDLWTEGNLKQRIRMVFSWILFFVTISLNPENLQYRNWETGNRIFQGTLEEYDSLKENYEVWFGLSGLLWLGFTVYSWYKRSKEGS